METGTHPGFPQILSPLSQCHDEPSRNSSSRLERGSFMRVEPEERVSFATHRGLLCLNEQQRVRVASSTNTFFHSSRSIDRTNGIVGIGLENSRRFCVTDQIKLINGYKVQENQGVTKESEFFRRFIRVDLQRTLKIWFCKRNKKYQVEISFFFVWINLFRKSMIYFYHMIAF